MVMLLSRNALGSPNGLSFRYDSDGASRCAGELRVFEDALKPVRGIVYVYATFGAIVKNPIRFVSNVPEWQPSAAPIETEVMGTEQDSAAGDPFVVQENKPFPAGRTQFLETIALGQKSGAEFVPALRFGLADDRRAEENALVTAWVSDGHIDYFGPYVRPGTQYDFKIRLDLTRKRMTAWVRGRGDEDWFLLAEDVPLHSDANVVDHVNVEMYPGGPAIDNVVAQAKKWRDGERLRPNPLAKSDRVVKPGVGFKFQPMCSTWRKPGKHVTIFREPGVHAGFPDVAQAGPGHLVCVWVNGSHTGGPGGFSLAHSYDNGKTWGKPVPVTAISGNCPRIQRLKDGNLLLLADVPSSGNQFKATWDLVMCDSTDGGKTWTNERWLRKAEVGGGGCIVPSHICEMSDGSWLLAASYFAPPPRGGSYVEILDYYRSTDRGRTWKFLSSPNNYPPFCLSEPSPVLLPSGRLVVVARESRYDGMPGAKGYSEDGGKTWSYQELPYSICGRTCAGLLKDGRMMNTFRGELGREGLRAWIGDPEDPTLSQPAGGHFNDSDSVGLKDGSLHIDSDGACGQFTSYTLRPADTEKSTVDVTFEVKVLSNKGRAATVSVPFAGKLRIFPDHIEMFHDSSIRAAVTPGQFHTYRVISRIGRMQLFVDGTKVIDTDKADSSLTGRGWTRLSIYALQFGNEEKGTGASNEETRGTHATIWPANITSEVTGYSIWRSFDAVIDDPFAGRRVLSWVASKDGFPDQYQLDHILEVEATTNGQDQGYSGWIQLDDGRIFVVAYTDDTSSASIVNENSFGVPWIRGTFLDLSDLPSVK